jgi:hypothetical protein
MLVPLGSKLARQGDTLKICEESFQKNLVSVFPIESQHSESFNKSEPTHQPTAQGPQKFVSQTPPEEFPLAT